MQNTPKAACEAPQSPVGLMTRKQDKQISPNPPLPLFNQRNVLVYTRESKQFHLMKGILLHLKKKKETMEEGLSDKLLYFATRFIQQR
jgi:hypothetical protein